MVSDPAVSPSARPPACTPTRPATGADRDALARLDPLLGTSAERHDAVARAIADGRCLVVDDGFGPIAYGVVGTGLLGHGFVELIVVAERARRRGVGRRLLAALAERSGRRRVFTSTNASNAPMRALLGAGGWRSVGELSIDPGDPELFFERGESGAA